MTRLLIFFTLTLISILDISCSKTQQSQNDQYISKVKTIESTIETLYEVISGEKDQPRNWELFKYLFHDNAKLINYQPDEVGNWELRFRSPDEYIRTSGKYLQSTGFYEKQISIDIDSFGKIAIVRSIYESYNSKYDTKPFMRGFNSFQLIYHNERWWIVNNYWLRETDNWPLPDIFLEK